MPLSSQIRPEPNPPLDRVRVIRAREMYAEGLTVSRILAHCQMSLGTLYACLDGVPFGLDGERMEPIPRRRQVTGKRRRALVADDVSLVNRLLRTAERQVRDIETRLSAREQAPVERERCVRMLTSLTRALRDLAALRKQSAAARTPISTRSAVNLPTSLRPWRPALRRPTRTARHKSCAGFGFGRRNTPWTTSRANRRRRQSRRKARARTAATARFRRRHRPAR